MGAWPLYLAMSPAVWFDTSLPRLRVPATSGRALLVQLVLVLILVLLVRRLVELEDHLAHLMVLRLQTVVLMETYDCNETANLTTMTTTTPTALVDG